MSMFNFFSNAPYGVSITDRGACMRCGDCVEKASDIFYLAGDGKVMINFPLPADGQQRAEDATAACPAGIIVVDPE